jgi:hypothetical protein
VLMSMSDEENLPKVGPDAARVHGL